MTYEEIARGIVSAHNVRDSAGRLHWHSGILTWDAPVIVHVCFDNFHGIGQRLHFVAVDEVRKAIQPMWWDIAPAGGSRDGVYTSATGAGYNFAPKLFPSWMPVRFDHALFDEEKDISDRAVDVVKDFLRRDGCHFRKANLTEQLSGLDLMVRNKSGLSTIFQRFGKTGDFGLEIKSRGKDKTYPGLFYQTSETNPEGRIS